MTLKRFLGTFLLAVLVIGWGAFCPSYGEDMGLTGLLMSKLGVSNNQAQGGVGAIFQLAKSRLGTEDFGSVAKAVPAMDTLLGAAPKTKGGTSGLGRLSSMLGGKSTSLGGLADLAGSFGQLGLSVDMVGKFIPIILDYVKGTGGSKVMNLLKGALT
jgi:hypothetical protein